jgi:hypothetical protein
LFRWRVLEQEPTGASAQRLGIVGVGLFATFCLIYFVVLGYPLPQIHRYRPPTP